VAQGANLDRPFAAIRFSRIESPRTLIRRLGEGDKLAGPDVSFFGRRLVGHQQVTDAYLLALALRRGGVLVTFDGGVAALLEPKSPNAKFLEVLKP